MNNQERGTQRSIARVLALVCCALTVTVCHGSSRMASVLPAPRVMDIVVEEAERYLVPPELALAVASVESNFNTHAVSPAGARGVMQIMPKTARGEFGVAPRQLFDARTNVRLGVRFLRQLLNRYQRTDIALSHYNGGSAVNTRDGLRVIPATRGYVNKVMAQAQHYRHHPKVLALRDRPYPALADNSALDDFSDASSPTAQRSQHNAQQPAARAFSNAAALSTSGAERASIVKSLQEIRRKMMRRVHGLSAAVASPHDRHHDRVALVRSWENYDQ